MELDAPSVLRPGDTCWRIAQAERAAPLLDNDAYFRALAAALPKAQRSILVLGWSFDPRTVLEPDAEGQPTHPDGRIGDLLKRLAAERPQLDVRVLIWRMDLPIAASQEFYPLRAAPFFKNSAVKFRLDRTVPLGACHHQKVVVIDDAVAFCGGGDISVDRWDSSEHRHYDAGRRMPNGKIHPPRHDCFTVMSGPAARMLSRHVRRRWAMATGEALDTPEDSDPAHDPWPDHVPVAWRDVRIGAARTTPRWKGDPGREENERLHLAAIASARELIVLENQYVASPVIETALARTLQKPDGPEVLVLTTRKSPSWFDQATMDRTRGALIGRLRAADIYGRFRAYCPVTEGGDVIIVHSKVAIIDDRLLRFGSANLNNRSFGFDTEFDVMIEAETEAHRDAILAFRTQLLAHWLGVEDDAFDADDVQDGPGILSTIDRLAAKTERLVPVPPFKQGPIRNAIAIHHLGDPVEPTDSWLPWLRTEKLQRRTRALLGAGRSRR